MKNMYTKELGQMQTKVGYRSPYRRIGRDARTDAPRGDIRERFIIQGMVCGVILAILLVTTLVGLPFTERVRHVVAAAMRADYTESLPFAAVVSGAFERGRNLAFGELAKPPEPVTSATPAASEVSEQTMPLVSMPYLPNEGQAEAQNYESNTFYDVSDEDRLFIEDLIRQITKAGQSDEPETYPSSYSDAHTLAPAIAPGSARISSAFGNRTNPITRQAEFHNGVDIALAHGTPVVAIQDAVITAVGYNTFSGHYIRYKTLDGLLVGYAHLYQAQVQVGDIVGQGDVVALSGNTGFSTGPHLHVSIWRDGEVIDPLTVFAVQY